MFGINKFIKDIEEIKKNVNLLLLSHLNSGEPNSTKFKREIMRPILEEQWNETKAKKAIAINNALASKGEKIRQAFEKYREEKLKLEREQKPTTFVDAKLEVLNVLMDGMEIKEIQT